MHLLFISLYSFLPNEVNQLVSLIRSTNRAIFIHLLPSDFTTSAQELHSIPEPDNMQTSPSNLKLKTNIIRIYSNDEIHEVQFQKFQFERIPHLNQDHVVQL